MMPFLSWPNTIPPAPQLMPSGESARQIVTAAPPLTATLLSVSSPLDQKATDRPSGENTGLVANPPPKEMASVSGRASSSDIERR
jgi:hypothetical protein